MLSLSLELDIVVVFGVVYDVSNGFEGGGLKRACHTVVFVEEVVSDDFVLVSDVEVVKSEEVEVVVTESCRVSVSVSMRILVWISVEMDIVWMRQSR